MLLSLECCDYRCVPSHQPSSINLTFHDLENSGLLHCYYFVDEEVNIRSYHCTSFYNLHTHIHIHCKEQIYPLFFPSECSSAVDVLFFSRISFPYLSSAQTFYVVACAHAINLIITHRGASQTFCKMLGTKLFDFTAFFGAYTWTTPNVLNLSS